MKNEARVCVECMCDENESIYKKYSEGNLRLTRCIRCGDFVDRYVEYDNVLIVLDLVLHKNPAYRHLLFNDEKFSLRNRNTRELNMLTIYLLLRISFFLIIGSKGLFVQSSNGSAGCTS